MPASQVSLPGGTQDEFPWQTIVPKLGDTRGDDPSNVFVCFLPSALVALSEPSLSLCDGGRRAANGHRGTILPHSFPLECLTDELTGSFLSNL